MRDWSRSRRDVTVTMPASATSAQATLINLWNAGESDVILKNHNTATRTCIVVLQSLHLV